MSVLTMRAMKGQGRTALLARALGVATLLAAAAPVPAVAQQADVLISAMRRVTDEAPSPWSSLTLDVRAQSALGAEGGVARSTPLRLDLSTPVLPWRGAEWRLRGAWLRGLDQAAAQRQFVDVSASALTGIDRHPIRFEAGVRVLDASTAGARVLAALEPVAVTRRLRFAAGLELYVGDSRIATGAPGLGQDSGAVFPDTLVSPGSENTLRTSRSMNAVSSVSLGASWRAIDLDLRAWQRLPLDAAARRQLAPRLETALEANIPVTGRGAVVAMLGDRSYGGETPGPHLAIGLRWSTGRRREPPPRRAPLLALCGGAGGTGAAIRVHAPGARRVEIEGDPTAWKPRSLAPSAPEGWWELAVGAVEGVQRVRLRIDDGAWRAPSGHPTELSEFGGEVAVLRSMTRAAACGLSPRTDPA